MRRVYLTLTLKLEPSWNPGGRTKGTNIHNEFFKIKIKISLGWELSPVSVPLPPLEYTKRNGLDERTCLPGSC